MFSRWVVTNIISAQRTLHCRKTRIPCRDQLVICGLNVFCESCLQVMSDSTSDGNRKLTTDTETLAVKCNRRK
jgi:hypothetical protein